MGIATKANFVFWTSQVMPVLSPKDAADLWDVASQDLITASVYLDQAVYSAEFYHRYYHGEELNVPETWSRRAYAMLEDAGAVWRQR